MKDLQSFVDILVNKYKTNVKGTGPIKFHLGADFEMDPEGTLVMSPTKYIARMVQTYEWFFGCKPSTKALSPLVQTITQSLTNLSFLMMMVSNNTNH